MSERLTNHEAHKTHESSNSKPEKVHKPEVNKDKLEADSKQLLEQSRKATEQLATPSKKLAAEKEDTHQFHVGTHAALKRDTYRQLIKEIQSKLPKNSRAFSKVIHQKNIEAISNVSANTIARPSGLLGGGIGALIGTTIALRYSRHYGFEYNNSVFLIMFAGGFVLGLLVEMVLKLLRRRKS